MTEIQRPKPWPGRPPAPGPRPVTLLAAAVALAACGASEPSSPELRVTRDTLPDGAVRVSYAELPASDVTVLEPELTIGVLEGPEEYIFGDVRSVDALADGTILVLDYQGPEIRAYGPDGTFSHVVAERGEGPGELGSANGMVVRGDSIVWVHDHGHWKMIGLRPDGSGEVARTDLPLLSYGYTFDGQVDDEGRVWKFRRWPVDESRDRPQEGVNEGQVRAWAKYLAPGAEAADSIFVYQASSRSFVQHMGTGGFRVWGVPFDHTTLSAVDAVGHIWVGDPDAYRLVRLAPSGDTTLVMEAAVEPLPVTDADREAWRAPRVERMPDQARTLDDLLAMAPENRSVLAALYFDDRDRVWVEREVAAGDPAHFDVFSADGTWEGAFRLGFERTGGLPIRIRHGHLYAVVLDSLEVPRVVRAPVPGG